MSLDDDLESFFGDGIECVVHDSDKFRRKLNIGADAFKYLSNAENLGAFTTAITSGAGAAGMALVGWYSSMGILSQIGFAIGFLSTPLVWVAVAGAGGAATAYLTQWIYQSAKTEAVTEIPNFINSPLDVLASSLCDLICPVLLKIAYADANFCQQERERIRTYFIDEWGIDTGYVDNLLNYDEAHLSSYNWTVLDQTLLAIEKSGDIKYSYLAEEIIQIAEGVMLADGIKHEGELEEIQKLKEALALKVTCKSRTGHLLRKLFGRPPKSKE